MSKVPKMLHFKNVLMILLPPEWSLRHVDALNSTEVCRQCLRNQGFDMTRRGQPKGPCQFVPIQQLYQLMPIQRLYQINSPLKNEEIWQTGRLQSCACAFLQ